MDPHPLITADLPGSGGRIKVAPEDFRVDEIPAYAPCGQGPHLYLQIEKRGRTTRDVLRELAAALGVQEREAGFAGLKDKRAVTTQWMSFPSPRTPGTGDLAGEGWRLLSASRHGNRLRTGHLRGNRFALAVRGGDLSRARACAAALRERGLPNFFGAQRFGAEHDNAAVGKAILLGDTGSPHVRRAVRDRFLRRLCISAYQSLLFNRWLSERMADGLFARALVGDVMKRLEGGLFTCQDPAADEPRIARFEISPAGPIFGHKMMPAGGEALARESRLLAAEAIALADFAAGRGEAEGTRRVARLPLEVELEPLPDGYRASFSLPRGSYATVVMAELVKEGPADLAEGPE